MEKCKCGEEIQRDGYDNIEIVDGYICIKGTGYCTCGKIFQYEDVFYVDLKKPFESTFDDITEKYK